MTASALDVGAWVERALDRKGLDSGDLVFELLDHGPIKRWTCSDENCPARPDWDKALSDLLSKMGNELDNEIHRVTTKTLVKGLTAFLAEHPDTPLRQMDEAA